MRKGSISGTEEYQEGDKGGGCLIIQSYNDICSKIAILEKWIDSLERDIKYYSKLLYGGPRDMGGINYDGMPKGSRNDMTLDRVIEAIHKAESHLVLATEELTHKTQSRIDIEGVLSKMEGLEHQVFYYRVVRGLSQEETAEAIERCTRQVQRIEKSIKMSCECRGAV
jgi:DNA-directed RNA polymerase specialized sigma24 family protein